MRKIEKATQFKADYKREIKKDTELADTLKPILEGLANDVPLPEKCRDHRLKGKWKKYRDCHVKPDLVLLYKKHGDVLSLARLGSHSELFG